MRWWLNSVISIPYQVTILKWILERAVRRALFSWKKGILWRKGNKKRNATTSYFNFMSWIHSFVDWLWFIRFTAEVKFKWKSVSLFKVNWQFITAFPFWHTVITLFYLRARVYTYRCTSWYFVMNKKWERNLMFVTGIVPYRPPYYTIYGNTYRVLITAVPCLTYYKYWETASQPVHTYEVLVR